MSLLNRSGAQRASGRRCASRAIWTDGTRPQPHIRISTPAPACRARFATFAAWLDELRDRRHRRSGRALFRRTPGRAAGADLPPPRSCRASGACHRLPEVHAAADRPASSHVRAGLPAPPPRASSPASASARSWTSVIRSTRSSAAALQARAESSAGRNPRIAADQCHARRRVPRPSSTTSLSRIRRSRSSSALDDMTPRAGDQAR